jgi:hypothetical protein
MQNGHIESFNGRLRDECLNANWFRNLFDARHKVAPNHSRLSRFGIALVSIQANVFA